MAQGGSTLTGNRSVGSQLSKGFKTVGYLTFPPGGARVDFLSTFQLNCTARVNKNKIF